ncbi:multinuclear nonheme iron-dependent oxidase, partial [Escherichia coli]|uniref:multinuclear nonheme iron-dependent oxidase n=1 Tax=Escherichia coli TaxID=562 RepID=UPI00159B8DB1
MGEGDFHAEIALATGCELLLDVGNLHANAVNAGLDPFAVLVSYPLERVAMLHVAGGVMEHGFYFDTHAHAVPDAVFALVEEVLEGRDVPVLLERDAGFEGHAAEIVAEVERLRAMP